MGTRDCSGLCCCCCCCCNKHTALTSDNAVPRQPAPSLPPTSVLLPTPPSPFSPPHQLAPRVDTRRPMNYTPRTARRMPALRLMTSLVVSRTSVRSGSTLHDGGLRRLHYGWNERQWKHSQNIWWRHLQVPLTSRRTRRRAAIGCDKNSSSSSSSSSSGSGSSITTATVEERNTTSSACICLSVRRLRGPICWVSCDTRQYVVGYASRGRKHLRAAAAGNDRRGAGTGSQSVAVADISVTTCARAAVVN